MRITPTGRPRSNSSLASTSPSSRRPTAKSTRASCPSSPTGTGTTASRPSSSRSVGSFSHTSFHPHPLPWPFAVHTSPPPLTHFFSLERWLRSTIASFPNLPKARPSNATMWWPPSSFVSSTLCPLPHRRISMYRFQAPDCSHRVYMCVGCVCCMFAFETCLEAVCVCVCVVYVYMCVWTTVRNPRVAITKTV